jgi:hypothetical protein
VLDRASSLADSEIVKLLSTRFVPLAIDQHVHRQLKDAEGEQFAAVLKQAGRGLDGMSQGQYLFTPKGKLLSFSNTPDAAHVKRLIDTALKKFDLTADVPESSPGQKPAPPPFEPPPGTTVVDVTTKVLGGYEKATIKPTQAAQEALGRDHLWLRKDEVEALARGLLPESVKTRIVRYHLIDNTRGEPPMWSPDDVKKLEMTLKDGRLTGSVELTTKSGKRGYRAKLFGNVKVEDGKLTRFDVVAKGEFWGEGTFTRSAPPGEFPLAIAFTLTAGTSAADRALPGGARANLKGYLR